MPVLVTHSPAPLPFIPEGAVSAPPPPQHPQSCCHPHRLHSRQADGDGAPSTRPHRLRPVQLGPAQAFGHQAGRGRHRPAQRPHSPRQRPAPRHGPGPSRCRARPLPHHGPVPSAAPPRSAPRSPGGAPRVLRGPRGLGGGREEAVRVKRAGHREVNKC